ncbi:hypothetical protein GCM10025876_20720 [Demequina litorisediminis]|uniref:Type I phosphodiesterase / nucleotide pyrophosphatase n=1 Tax=Demequina litorisediminis TaxID=1849022 RepID=A0ABQ6IGK8_9MICO|nr:hypothetical protein GCM10025876_20720 [Demequina litorisediminis]
MPAPLLQAELRAGNLPTLSRWIRGGTHTWTEWTARVPSTTPVSQAGILHGSNEDIPAFRWWDRDLGRMLVANKPADAAVIESRISDGRGLLADEGVSISNLFTGDAATVHLTMSAVAGGASALGSSRPYAAFFSHPAGFARALVMTVGEMLKEVAQGRSQERRGIEPRVARHGSYIALRGVTNVMLRDLNTALVVESMVRGAKAVYVDYVDYDEIAHHAGVTRPESLASLYGLDRVLGTLERVAASGIAAREYDIVAVSDHGQSQGATFAQREGRSLEEFIAERTGGRAVLTAHDREGAGAPAALLVRELAAQGARSAQVAARALDREATADAGAGPREATPIAVVGSGNLGGVWFTAVDHAMSLAEVEEAHPGLVADLVGHPAVGFAVLRTSGGAVAIGAAGTRHLSTGEVAGEDPLAAYPDHTAADFARASAFHHAPDIYLNSTYDPVLDEVAAFEEPGGMPRRRGRLADSAATGPPRRMASGPGTRRTVGPALRRRCPASPTGRMARGAGSSRRPALRKASARPASMGDRGASGAARGCSSMAELQPSQPIARVRFPSPALLRSGPWCRTTLPTE